MKSLLEKNHPSLYEKLENEQCNEKKQEAYYEFVQSSNKIEKADFFTLLPDKRAALLDSTGKSIEKELKSLVDGLSDIADMVDKKKSHSEIADKMMDVGVAAFGVLATEAFENTLKDHDKITTEVIKSAIEIALDVAENLGEIGEIIAAIILVIIPIIYFMLKPAFTTVLIINDSNEDYKFGKHFNTHGKTTSYTTSITSKFEKDGQTFSNAGFFTSSKKDGALYGTQSGFTLLTGQETLAFGAECPLNGSNNCYCEFDKSAEQISKLTEKKKDLYHEVSKGGLGLNIRGNSKSGGLAWFIGRIYNT